MKQVSLFIYRNGKALLQTLESYSMKLKWRKTQEYLLSYLSSVTFVPNSSNGKALLLTLENLQSYPLKQTWRKTHRNTYYPS